MKTASHADVEKHHGHIPGVTDADPVHDIDAGRTVKWIAIWGLGIVVGFYLLYVLFSVVIQDERHRKVEGLPTVERNTLREWEKDQLQGGSGGRSIDDSMRRVLEKQK
jgi:hypothetical protein